MSHDEDTCGLFKDHVMTTAEWKAKHQPHSAAFRIETFKGPHNWFYLVCECGAKHLTDEVANHE